MNVGQFHRLHSLLLRYGALPDPITDNAVTNQLLDIVADLNERLEALEEKPREDTP